MLTTAQLQALKANILATPAALAFFQAGSFGDLVAFYNALAAPSFTVWKESVGRAEVMQNGFDWVRVDNLSVGQARIWEWLFMEGWVDPRKANVRAGIDETWKGTAPDLAVRAAVYVHCKRLVSRFERVFSIGTGSDAVPGVAVVLGPVDVETLVAARDLQ